MAEVAREKGVTEATIYRWRQRYGGLSRSELSRLRELEQENTRLKRIVAQQAMDIDGLERLGRVPYVARNGTAGALATAVEEVENWLADR